MKKFTFYCLSLILLNSCQSEQPIVEIREYICPQLGDNSILLYEYDNPSIDVYPVKYLYIQRDSIETSSYTYHFLDQNFEIISGFKEHRGDSLLKYENMIYLEEDENNQRQVQEINIDDWDVSYQLKMGTAFTLSTRWQSNVKPNVSYDYTSSRKLISKKEDFECMGDTIPVVVFRLDETYRIENDGAVSSNDIEMYMVYGEKVGLIEIKFFVDQAPKYLKLKRIYTEAEIMEMSE